VELAPVKWRLLWLCTVGNAVGAVVGGLVIAAFFLVWGELGTSGLAGVLKPGAAFAGVAFVFGSVYMAVTSPLISYLSGKAPAACSVSALALAIAPGVGLLWFDNRAFGLPALVHGVAACAVVLLLLKRRRLKSTLKCNTAKP
jgi:hypothetical protein